MMFLDETMSFGDRLSTAGIVTLEGMVVIFAVLAILWGIVELLHRALNRKQAPAPVVSAPVVAETEPVTEEKNTALIAVITAAIRASMEAQGQTTGFRVVSFKRTNK